MSYEQLNDRDDLEDALFPYLRQLRPKSNGEDDEDWDEDSLFPD